MKNLRLLAWLLALTILFGCLTACDLFNTDTNTQAGTETTYTPTDTDTDRETLPDVKTETETGTETETETETEATPTEEERLVKQAYGLAPGATLGTKTLTGVVTKINTPYSEQYKNITLTIVVGRLTNMPIECYRVKGADAATVKVGDTVTVTGELMNYAPANKVEFNAGATFVKVTDEPAMTPDEQLVVDAYALAAGATLGTKTLTGVVTKINTPYSEQFNNVTVTIVVGRLTDKPVECYRVKGTDAATVKVGDTITVTGELMNYAPANKVEFNAGSTFVTVNGDQGGTDVPPATDAPPVNEEARDAFYGNSDPADSYEEAVERSKQGIISGALTVPDQAPTISTYQPQQGGMLIRNNQPYFADKNTYVVVDAYGYEVFRVYRGGGYITLEEVAAYLYAFGDVPANYSASKNTSPSGSIWGQYLRVNHSQFSGSTSKYPYEPQLPRISGCGGDLKYYEIDIGTTGTTAGEGYEVAIYNNGYRIVRGAARIVYSRYDRNGNQIIEDDEKYIFYTYNHYNDFQEYLNYYGGWGKMFGNITGGGTLSSKYDYNPTPYVQTARAALPASPREAIVLMAWDSRRLADMLADCQPRVA